MESLSIGDLEARMHDSSLSFDERAEAAGEIAHRKMMEQEARHAAFHHVVKLRYGTVERRSGYRGRSVCLDCYYGREWKG